ncbi:hypothetical protein ABZ815_20995 [Nonomuraea sp. NPDC047529]|uniref:hypothetical protein n=1 Tax=Nonomuraea sp. NPDC047529 TaxID=3155623 RepID=UPI0033D0B7C9
MGILALCHQITVLQRQLGADGCVFTVELELGPDEKAVQGDETRLNLKTCQMELAIRRDQLLKTDDPTTGLTKETGKPTSPTKVEEAPSGRSRLSTSASAAWTRSEGYFETWWVDPINLTVNDVTNFVGWDWNGVNCIQPGWGNANYSWLTTTGWFKVADNFQNLYGCTDHRSESYAHYANGSFCGVAVPAAHAYYPRNVVQGWWDGNLTGLTDSYADSGCSFLLSHHYRVIRTYN